MTTMATKKWWQQWQQKHDDGAAMTRWHEEDGALQGHSNCSGRVWQLRWQGYSNCGGKGMATMVASVRAWPLLMWELGHCGGKGTATAKQVHGHCGSKGIWGGGNATAMAEMTRWQWRWQKQNDDGSDEVTTVVITTMTTTAIGKWHWDDNDETMATTTKLWQQQDANDKMRQRWLVGNGMTMWWCQSGHGTSETMVAAMPTHPATLHLCSNSLYRQQL